MDDKRKNLLDIERWEAGKRNIKFQAGYIPSYHGEGFYKNNDKAGLSNMKREKLLPDEQKGYRR